MAIIKGRYILRTEHFALYTREGAKIITTRIKASAQEVWSLVLQLTRQSITSGSRDNIGALKSAGQPVNIVRQIEGRIMTVESDNV